MAENLICKIRCEFNSKINESLVLKDFISTFMDSNNMGPNHENRIKAVISKFIKIGYIEKETIPKGNIKILHHIPHYDEKSLKKDSIQLPDIN